MAASANASSAMHYPTATATAIAPNELFGKMISSAWYQQVADKRVWSDFKHISLDPGETTGISFMNPAGISLIVDQIPTPNLEKGMDVLEQAIVGFSTKWPTIITMEDYKVYGWKADSHKWAGLHTPQLIGAITRLVYKNPHMALITRMAVDAKSFATDEQLKKWGLYNPGLKHGRDAERHLLTTLFYGKHPGVLWQS